MFINFYNTITATFIIQLLLNINYNNVKANPLNGIENQQLLSRIYKDESWNNDQEYHPKGGWISEMSENDRKNLNDDCKDSRTCGTTTDITVDMPIKREMFVSRGWGAGGMPFNVLYMKNPKSNKSLRSMSGIIAEPLRSQPMPHVQQFINDDLTTNTGGSTTGEIITQSYSSAGTTNPNNNIRPKGRSSNAVIIPSRRHYSIIPQLFVSYGWGPIGK